LRPVIAFKQPERSTRKMMKAALPANWLHHKLVEEFCTETNEEDGTMKLTAGVVDSPVLWLKFRTKLYPQIT
jgi:hypothetical protein